MKDVFANVYRNKVWGDLETVSGPGSTVARGADFSDELVSLLAQLNVKSVLDAGCGDFNWMKQVSLPVERYIGVDVVPELIADNEARYQTNERSFIAADISRDDLPPADLIFCRDCLVHFSLADVLACLRNFKRSGATWLLTTTFVEFAENADIETGGWRQLNLERPPFNLPVPDALIDEKCWHTGGIYADKGLALWQLDRIEV
jgi:SAM-dependent methyltransferase